MSKSTFSLEQRKATIRKLCQLLGREAPNLDAITDPNELKEPISMLTLEYRAATKANPPLALKYMATYYGLPGYGHQDCYRLVGGKAALFVNRSEPDIEQKHCSACGKLLIPVEEVHV